LARNGHFPDPGDLNILLDISHALLRHGEPLQSVPRMFEALEQHHSMLRGALALLSVSENLIHLPVVHGPKLIEERQARYKPGEGIIGRVVETGKPIVVPQVSKEPLFLNRSNVRKSLGPGDLTYICVPLVLDRRAFGALGICYRYNKDRDYEKALRFYRVIASMVSQSFRAQQLVEAERKRLLDENIHLKQELRERYDFSHIIGSSHQMRSVYEQGTQVARTNTTVLIRGESGTGKELIAHAIHYNSLRASKPFVKVNCAALPESLIESELFGYEKGAFTGAQARKKGRFELAEGGTIFLDEIGELSQATQIKLLRVLQEREFERLGGTETTKANVRVVAATNKDLENSIQSGSFREDLYYRLNVFSIYLPALRDRSTDIMLLADTFLEKYAREHHKRIKRISTPAIDMLNSYHWPGNVRELENCIERAVLVCDGNVIHGHHLPPTLQTAEGSNTVTKLSLQSSVEAYEKDIILDALKTTRGNRARAAKLLDSTERIINYKVGKYRIDLSRFKR